MKNPFSSTAGVVSAGLIIGLGAAILQKLGNPGNMGVCVACFGRDVVGAVGLHRADTVSTPGRSFSPWSWAPSSPPSAAASSSPGPGPARWPASFWGPPWPWGL
jgi:hypothetical protein